VIGPTGAFDNQWDEKMNAHWILIGEIIGGGLFGGLCGWNIPRVIEPWCQYQERQPLIALSTAVLCGVMVSRTADPFAQVAMCVLSVGLMALTLIDLRTHRLPREISYATLGLGVPWLIGSAVMSGDHYRVVGLALGALGAFVVMAGLYLISRGGLGDGDVRLSPLLGAYLCWFGPAEVIGGLYLSFVLGAIVGVSLMVCSAADRKTALPFGPFLAAGTLLVLVLPSSVLNLLTFEILNPHM
jgi:leader peptidase (prepilin peptidase)/N-methyltransferase